jgi:LysM repeat protein
MVKTLHARAAASEQDVEEYEGDSEPNMKFSHALIVVLALHILAVGGVFAFNALKSRHLAPDHAKPTANGVTPSNPAPDSGATERANSPTAENKAGNTAPLAAATPEKGAAKKQTADAGGQTYTVAAGDTLTRIASAHKTSVEELEQANGISNNSAIRVGQMLKIPSKSTAPAPKASGKPEPTTAKATESKTVPATKAPESKPQPATKTTESKTAPATTKTAAAASTPATATPTSPKEESKPAASDKSYTVAKGDNPYAIAKKLKVSYNDLIKANNIQDPTKLQIGQKLIIP